jgi:lysophospholipase L1-like esterase
MTMRIRHAAALVLMLGAALGAAAVIATEPSDDALRIVAFGDSTTAPRRGVGQVYADRLSALLEKRGIRAIVFNSGVGGSHTGRLADNARHRRRHALDRFQDAVRDHEPDIVIIQFGWNDSWIDGIAPENDSRIPLEDYVANLKTMAKTILRDGGQPILMTPNACRASLDRRQAQRTSTYADGVRKLSAELEISLVDVWREYDDYQAVDGRTVAELLLDNIHPNDRGHDLVARMLAAKIEQTIGATQ